MGGDARWLGGEAEGWVAVGDEDGGVGLDAGGVASDADHEVEKAAWVAGGDDDHEPAEGACDKGQEVEDSQNEVVGDG